MGLINQATLCRVNKNLFFDQKKAPETGAFMVNIDLIEAAGRPNFKS